MTPRQARAHRAVYTVPQAAEQLGVDPRQVYHWIKAGLLGCTRLPTRDGGPGGPIRIEDADVDAFRARYRQEAATQ